MTFPAQVIRSRACRQEEERQHGVLPAAAALLCGFPLPDVYCVLTSLPDLMEVAESCLVHQLTIHSLLRVIDRLNSLSMASGLYTPAQTS